MSFDLDTLTAAVAAHGRVARVVIAAVKGSAPREVGASMLVWTDGQSGTIGGGELEFRLAKAARRQTTQAHVSHHALGPEMGQCCGGAVTIVTERFDAASLPQPVAGVIARPVVEQSEQPLSVTRVLATARAQGTTPDLHLTDGWLVEPVTVPNRQIWIWGAGHVGRALVQVLAPLPGVAITWVDTGLDRFPQDIPDGVTVLPVPNPANAVARAPVAAEHLIVTYSHALDLELCHRLLSRGFAFTGLIGSATKWARFRSRLADLGHGPERIARITCPIGAPELGKHPQSIAIGVAASLLARQTLATQTPGRETEEQHA